jgi:hypothetical protein
MSGPAQLSYTLEFSVRRQVQKVKAASPSIEPTSAVIPRISRLMALAIRLEGLIRNGTIRDYAELARRGGVTRARMTQILNLLHLAPDIQEQLLFLTLPERINERNLRPIVRRIDWDEQRRMFQQITRGWASRNNRLLSVISPSE